MISAYIEDTQQFWVFIKYRHCASIKIIFSKIPLLN
ncbi:MAG: hypothetical protein QG657_3116 [Acidobacteriota bacterium]|nr:hypothetical protein [Acidobacteriota bacterium]